MKMKYHENWSSDEDADPSKNNNKNTRTAIIPPKSIGFLSAEPFSLRIKSVT